MNLDNNFKIEVPYLLEKFVTAFQDRFVND